MGDEVKKFLNRIQIYNNNLAQVTELSKDQVVVSYSLNKAKHIQLRILDFDVDDQYCNVDLILKEEKSTYSYILSEYDMQSLLIESTNINIIIEKFINRDYIIESEGWLIFKRTYMVIKDGQNEFGLLKTK